MTFFVGIDEKKGACCTSMLALHESTECMDLRHHRSLLRSRYFDRSRGGDAQDPASAANQTIEPLTADVRSLRSPPSRPRRESPTSRRSVRAPARCNGRRDRTNGSQKPFTRRPRVPSPQDGNEGLANGERPLRWLGDSAARLTAASALLLATNLLWIIAVVLNVIGPVGSLSAGLLAWLAFVLDIPGVLLLAAAYAGLTREQGLGWNRRRLAIVWGFIFWTGVSVYWRFILPLAIGTDLQDLFLGLLGANPGGLRLAQASWASMDELFAWWIAAGAVFFATHVLIAVDYRRASEGEWTAGLPAYVWVLGPGVSRCWRAISEGPAESDRSERPRG